MNNFYPVLIQWSDEKIGNLPTSGEYVTVSRFPEDKFFWPNQAWSVVVKIKGDVHGQACEAYARFLSPQAPEERFQSGATFELLEGDKVMAAVVVI